MATTAHRERNDRGHAVSNRELPGSMKYARHPSRRKQVLQNRPGDDESVREGRPADSPTCRGRADHGSDRVAVRSGRQVNSEGQVGQTQRVRLLGQLAEVTENTKPGAWGLILPAGQPGRGHAAAGYCRRAATARDQGPRGRGRRRVRCRPDECRARGPGAQASIHRWPPGTGLQGAPPKACGTTAPARRAESATSSAGTGWTDPASRATTAGRS